MQNPQNPYSNPSVAPGVSPRGPEISFDSISQAWKLLQPNIGTWIGAALIYGVIIFAFSGIQNAVAPPRINASTGTVSFGPLYYLFSLIGFLIGQFFVGGLFRMAIANVRTGRAELGQMFSAGNVMLNLIIAGILTTLALALGFVACIIPGLLLCGLFMFVTPLIVDKEQGAIQAMGNSVNALKPQMGMALVYVLVIGLLAGAGALACGIGMLVTAPLALLSLAVTYNNFFGGGQITGQPPMPPSAPIADPFR